MKGPTWLGLLFGIALLISLFFPENGLSLGSARTVLDLGNLGDRSLCQTSPIRLMPLGDSITHGSAIAGGYRIPLWNQFLEEGWDIDFVGSQENGPSDIDRDHEGHPGKPIQYIRERIIGWLDTYHPHVVLLMIGTNDVLYPQVHDFANADYRLNALIYQITQALPETELLVASIPVLADPVFNERARVFNLEIPPMVDAYVNQGKRVHYVDMYGALTPSDLADGIHPNARGYEKIAGVWHSALSQIMEQRC